MFHFYYVDLKFQGIKKNDDYAIFVNLQLIMTLIQYRQHRRAYIPLWQRTLKKLRTLKLIFKVRYIWHKINAL